MCKDCRFFVAALLRMTRTKGRFLCLIKSEQSLPGGGCTQIHHLIWDGWRDGLPLRLWLCTLPGMGSRLRGNDGGGGFGLQAAAVVVAPAIS